MPAPAGLPHQNSHAAISSLLVGKGEIAARTLPFASLEAYQSPALQFTILTSETAIGPRFPAKIRTRLESNLLGFWQLLQLVKRCRISVLA